jgi:predicted HNH restriction endonuclease
MALSDQLAKLSARAKEAEEHAAAARDKTKADVENDRELARVTADAQAEQLREAAAEGKGKISDWWNDVQRTWDGHVATVRDSIEGKKAELDSNRAERNAENAEDDAAFAIDYAAAAIVEAEYAVLDAVVARKQADELTASA